MWDQRKIVKNLPDGVLICRHLIEGQDIGDTSVYPLIEGQGRDSVIDMPCISMPVAKKTRIKFYNSAFKDLLNLKYDFNDLKKKTRDDEHALIIGQKQMSSDSNNAHFDSQLNEFSNDAQAISKLKND